MTQSANGAISPGTASYAQGGSQAETITPNSGYLIGSITVDGGSVTVTSGSGQTVNFNNIQGTHSITATFVQITYQITFGTVGSGTTNPIGTQTYSAGQGVSITATPGAGYSFSSWSASPSGSVSFSNPSSASTTMTINGAGTITATFTQITYQVTFASVGSGTTNPIGTQTYSAGQGVSITATPITGYSFSSWSASPSASVTFGNATAASTTATIKGNGTLTASFTLNTYNVTILTSGAGNVTRSAQGPYHYGDTVTLTANPSIGYIFTGWTGGLNETGNPIQITFNANMTVTATFTQSSYSVSVMVFPSSNAGTVAASPSSPYHYGDTVNLTASPSTGYTFSGWSGDGNGTGNTRTVTVTGNMVATAIFAQINYQVSFTTYGGGSDSITNPSGIQQYTVGQIVQINATAGNGYTFSSWQTSDLITFDNVTLASTWATINGAGTITAAFTQNPTPTPTPTPISEQTPTPTTPSPSPTPQTSPIPTPNTNRTSETIAAISTDGSVTHIVIYGSLDGADVSNATISADPSASQTTVTLTLTGQSSPDGFFNITIPKEAIKYGTTPTIYVNSQAAQNQGFTKDASNYYLWYTSYTQNYELSITFTGAPSTQIWVAIIVAVIATVLVIAIVIPKIRRQN